jgi:SAM-dependent methyltransferase
LHIDPCEISLIEKASMNFWDQNYSVEGYKYGVAPNVFLVEQAKYFPTNALVLVPGDGEGRNGVWLAKMGHRVTSIDSSKVGLDKALALARQEGVSIQTCLADLSNWSPQLNSADVVILTFLHLPSAIRSNVHQRLVQALKPGGLLVLEAFHSRQLNYGSGGPKSAEMLYRLETIRADFVELLEEVAAWEGEIHLDEGPGHQGAAYVIRWVGKKWATVK